MSNSDQTSAAQEATVTTDVSRRKRRAKAPTVGSIGQLIRSVYIGTFRRKSLNKKEISAICDAPALDVQTQEREELLNQTLADRTLSKTFQLMLLSVGLSRPFVTAQIRAFVRDVLIRHPAFTEESLMDAERQAVKAIASLDYANLPWDSPWPDHIKLTRIEEIRCRENAVRCLLLWFQVARGAPVERILRHLQDCLWEPAARGYKTDADKLRLLMNTRDSAAALLSARIPQKEAHEQSQRADVAQRRGERAAEQTQKVVEELAEAQSKLASSQTEIGTIREKFDQERRAHSNSKAHLKDDYERLRSRIIRRLKDELALLDEGLHALRREPPRVHVMVDHAERAIGGLKSEMERLRGSGGDD